ncbi:DUF6538 domain-containing protein [Rhizobium leguminosarum]|uniref:Integrase n=1 Tax=Rhizobium leguminosarum TaxID=384 RepID=A0A2K9Z387_RHILE|nr:tyrosine-type recombinase/integrase [Rhizobium leguminosarum]AUW42695.1 Integrase [Rhizobium leguminosarum]
MEMPDDRYLTRRNGVYCYKRRVPAVVADEDNRGPIIRISLKTRDLAKARLLRDGYARADDDLWGAYLASDSKEAATKRYLSAVRRLAALGFTYRTTMEILQVATRDELFDRVRALMDCKPNSPTADALLGTVERPEVTIRAVFDVYVNEIATSEIANKSPGQRRGWLNTKRRALNNFVAVVGDKPIGLITREDGKAFYKWWQQKIAPPSVDGKKQPATHTPTCGNRDIGNMRLLYQKYHEYMGEEDVKNPFAKLGFSEKTKRTRPPFERGWILEKILAPGALRTLNDEARAIVLILIETGARLSEIANLNGQQIFVGLMDLTPHINVRGHDEDEDEDDGTREVKTNSSIREIPLVGVALEALKKFPDGFPRYRDKGTHLSNTLNKYFREHHLFPSKKHKIYSLRHSFEDRMTEAGIDTEVRMLLMGHTSSRPKYGKKGSLAFQRKELLKIALPFDPAIV